MNSLSLIKLAQILIQTTSIKPKDHDCHKIIIDYLKKLDFSIELMRFEDTLNIWAYHNNYKKQQKPTLLFLGHTDVVTPGNLKYWKYPPFSGSIDNNILYGRGASDMKGALAAMLIAAKKFLNQHVCHPGRLAFIITSDEEGTGINGTTKVIKSLIERNEKIDYCIVGEPSSQYKLGDVIKNGRRGSLTGTLIIYGSPGHVAYPQFSKNPIHLVIPALSDILNTTWDQKKDVLFPPTTIQITNINTNNKNSNVTPEKITLNFNLRFNNMHHIDTIKKNISKILQYYSLNYHVYWEIAAEPYFSKPNTLTNTVIDVIKYYQKFEPILETTGGTSDGRFIAKMGTEIIELGALNNTIHKFNEYIDLNDLQLLSKIYQKIMNNILLNTK